MHGSTDQELVFKRLSCKAKKIITKILRGIWKIEPERVRSNYFLGRGTRAPRRNRRIKNFTFQYRISCVSDEQD